MKTKVKVLGADAVRDQLRHAASEARSRLRGEINTLGILLAAHVQQTKLRGQVLNQRSGRLISSIHHELEETDAEVNALVGTNVEYAAVHELGFSGTVQVKEHYRTVKKAWGRPIAPVQAAVASHARKMNMPQRAFLAPSLVEFTPRAMARLRAFTQALLEGRK